MKRLITHLTDAIVFVAGWTFALAFYVILAPIFALYMFIEAIRGHDAIADGKRDHPRWPNQNDQQF